MQKPKDFENAIKKNPFLLQNWKPSRDGKVDFSLIKNK